MHIYEDNDTCHTTCACIACCPTSQPPGLPSDPVAPVPNGLGDSLTDDFASRDDDDDGAAVDWQALFELYNIYAPLSGATGAPPGSSNDPPASSTPGASSSTITPTDKSILARIASRQMPQPLSHVAAASSGELAGDSTSVDAPAPIVMSKPPALK